MQRFKLAISTSLLGAVLIAGCGQNDKEAHGSPARLQQSVASSSGQVLIVLPGLGRFVARCSNHERYTLTFRADKADADVTVYPPGAATLHRAVQPGASLSITLAVTKHAGSSKPLETPTVRWIIRQTTEPNTVKARVRLKVGDFADGTGRCIARRAQLSITSRRNA